MTGSDARNETWRLLPHHIGDSEGHMTLTDRLVRLAAVHGPSAWWHATNETTLLVGPAMHRVQSLEAPLGIRVVRRHTGGGAVLVGRGVWGLDVALPTGHRLVSSDILRDYEWIGRVWEAALGKLGMPARCIGIEESRLLSGKHNRYVDASLACFALAAPFEVLAGDRKLVGLSQVRRGRGVLFSSAVHIDLAPSSVAMALPLAAARRHRLAAHLNHYAGSLDEVSGAPVSIDEVRTAFRGALGSLYGIRLRAGSWPDADRSQGVAAASAR